MQRSSPRRSTHRGFTLIELMITVAIVAILARVALPAYLDYAKRGKLTEAFNQLSASSLAFAQYYQDNRTYASVTSVTPALNPPCPSATANFTYTCTNLTTTTYLLTATGSTSSTTNFTFTLDQTGNRQTTSAPSGWPTNTGTPGCWVASRSSSSCQ